MFSYGSFFISPIKLHTYTYVFSEVSPAFADPMVGAVKKPWRNWTCFIEQTPGDQIKDTWRPENIHPGVNFKENIFCIFLTSNTTWLRKMLFIKMNFPVISPITNDWISKFSPRANWAVFHNSVIPNQFSWKWINSSPCYLKAIYKSNPFQFWAFR